MNSELLYITRKLGYPSSFGKRSGPGDFLEQYPDGIYAETGAGAPMGWESAAVWFGGDSERAAARFERMMSERNELSRLFRTRVSGVLVLTFIYRLKSRMVTAIPIAGGQPQPIDPTWLYFTMPNGGVVTLTRNGNPTPVTLEYSLDNGASWTEWIENNNVRTVTLAAGQTVHIRNTSETSTRFSTSTSNYYNFAFTDIVYAYGDTRSLLCSIPSNAVISVGVFIRLFQNCTSLVTAPELPAMTLNENCYLHMFRDCTSLVTAPELPAMTLFVSCYSSMFQGCTSLVTAPELPARYLAHQCYSSMFANCTSLNNVTMLATDISATNCLKDWLLRVSATGDLYCPNELTIPTGTSGIPSGWTRHDI